MQLHYYQNAGYTFAKSINTHTIYTRENTMSASLACPHPHCNPLQSEMTFDYYLRCNLKPYIANSHVYGAVFGDKEKFDLLKVHTQALQYTNETIREATSSLLKEIGADGKYTVEVDLSEYRFARIYVFEDAIEPGRKLTKRELDGHRAGWIEIPICEITEEMKLMAEFFALHALTPSDVTSYCGLGCNAKPAGCLGFRLPSRPDAVREMPLCAKCMGKSNGYMTMARAFFLQPELWCIY
jgi:hypothetical protein